MRSGLAFLALLAAVCLATPAKALDLSEDLAINGYLDARAVASADPQP